MTDPGNDYHPAGYCPGCEYPIDAGRCPECGRSVHVRELRARPRRFRRVRFLPVVLLMLLPIWPTVRAFRHRPLRLTPAAVLFARADTAADDELWARLRHGSLSHKDMRRFSRGALLTKPASTTRPTQPTGVPIRLRTDLNPRIGNEDCYLSADVVNCTVDGQLVSFETEQDDFFERLSEVRYRLPSLREGVHTVKVDQQFTWEGSGGFWHAPYRWRERRTQLIVVRGKLSDYASAEYSAALARQVKDSLTATFRYSTSPAGSCDGPCRISTCIVVDIKHLPIDLAGKMDIRYGSGEWHSLDDAKFTFSKPRVHWSTADGKEDEHWLAADKVNWSAITDAPAASLRFTPDAQTAFEEGLKTYFGGTIEWDNLHLVQYEQVQEGTGNHPDRITRLGVDNDR